MMYMEISENKNTTKYVVLKNEWRTTPEDLTLEEAQTELDRCRKIRERWPDGSKLKIQEIVAK